MNKRGRAMGFYAVMVSRLDGTPITTGVTCKISRDGAASQASFFNPIHLGDGVWYVARKATEADAEQVGVVFIHASGVNQGGQISTVAFDPDDANALGVAGLSLTPDGFIKADLRAIQGLQQPAINLREATNTIATGIVGPGATNNTIPTSIVVPAVVTIEQMRGRVMGFPADTLTAELRAFSTNVLSVAINGTFIVDNMPVAPQAGDKFVIS